jgi:hypothetical protein
MPARSEKRAARRAGSDRGHREQGQQPGPAEPRTRKPLAPWDRLKFILLLSLLWLVLVWSDMANDPIIGFADAVRQQLTAARWVLILLAAEILRQIHFLISEHWAGYHRIWAHGVFGRADRATHQMSDWTRFRISRVLKWLLAIAVLAVLLGRAFDTTPGKALAEAPAKFVHILPLLLYVIAIISLGILQFVGIFWFMSKGGVDVYYPSDITTRFSDVWGQDHVRERVQENMLFLEDPESIEEKGGYVPGGILLWGPPGTGKTLMAEAVAGETGKPYVFVDPGAFINMFFGVGILKVKSLFRKLRRLAVRYGGVIVFFDEADALGNRGGGVGQGGGVGYGPVGISDACHGFSHLSQNAQSALLADSLKSKAAADPRPPTRHRQMIPGMGGGNGGGMGTLQALLTELSGLKKPRGFFNRIVRRTLGMRPKPPPKYRILVMMATNLPSALDEALLRPGRLDRVYRVGYPSKEGLASLVGERMFFDGDSSSGVSGDLQNATTIALAMEGLWGMGGQYGSYGATRAPLGAHPVADGNDRNVLETALGQRAEAHLAALAERTRVLLAEHRANVLAVGHALEMHKTISGQDVTAIIDGSQGPLVDGRPYKTPEFAAELESYHQQVLAAHHGSDGSLPLPVPAPAAVELDAISAMNPRPSSRSAQTPRDQP